jgi:hypothetical protein
MRSFGYFSADPGLPGTRVARMSMRHSRKRLVGLKRTIPALLTARHGRLEQFSILSRAASGGFEEVVTLL